MKECYGKMFPPLTALRQLNHTASGKVFAAQIHSDGPMQHEPQLTVSLEEWEDCQGCPQYRRCYDLSNAKLAMEQTLYRIG